MFLWCLKELNLRLYHLILQQCLQQEMLHVSIVLILALYSSVKFVLIFNVGFFLGGGGFNGFLIFFKHCWTTQDIEFKIEISSPGAFTFNLMRQSCYFVKSEFVHFLHNYVLRMIFGFSGISADASILYFFLISKHFIS